MIGKLKSFFGPQEHGLESKLPRIHIEKRYQIVAETRQGSMSRVFKALDLKTGRMVCLKIQDAEKQAAAVARASREGRPHEGEILAKIQHPNVVRHYDHGLTTKHEHFVSMEFVEGASVQYLREAHALKTSERLSVLLQAAEALAAVHSRGFLHHDFGPRNLIVTNNRLLKLIDFGLAVPDTPAFHRPGNRTGNLFYMAPELVRREPIDKRIDVFSFGATAFELLTHRLPYDATTSMAQLMQRINQEPLDPLEAKPKMPESLAAFLRKAVARKKEDRFANMDEVITALKPFCPAPAE